MRQTRVILYSFFLCLSIAFIFGQATSAKDKDAKFYENAFMHWSKVIVDLKEADTSNEAAKDIEVIRTWIGQGQAFLASDKIEEIEPIIKKIGAQAEYVRSKINRLSAEAAAEEAEDLAKLAEQKAQHSKEATEAAIAKMKELEAQGL
jgi:hypothetical protein